MFESTLAFFESIPPVYRTIMLVTGLVLLWALEGALPLFSFRYNKFRHALPNLFFTLTTAVVNFSLAWLLVSSARFASAEQFGLLYLADLPLWLHVILGVMLLDFVGAWLIHWIEHKVRWMWKFHVIHHSDVNVDVTTALRHHPGESFFRATFTILAVLIAGVPIGVVFLYQSLSALFAQLTHANISLPPKIDALLSWVIVSPNMHKVHHHYKQPLTDSNYGNIFAIWDRLFRTFRKVDDSRTLTYGIDTHMKEEEHSRLGNLLAIPFQPYRRPGGDKGEK